MEQYVEKWVENNTFDILVANPPYSVSWFKEHLKLKNNSLEILEYITKESSSIEDSGVLNTVSKGGRIMKSKSDVCFISEKDNLRKTGRHFDQISEVLDQIKDGAEWA